MPRRALPKSIRVSAAASVVACTAGLAADSVDAAPAWSDALHLNGTFVPNAPEGDGFYIDFNQDDIDDFFFYYYIFQNGQGGFLSATATSWTNPNVDVLFDSVLTTYGDPPHYYVVPTVFDDRQSVFDAAVIYEPLPRPLRSIGVYEMQNQFTERAYLGSTFQSDDGKTYASYLELEMFHNGDYTQAYLTVHDAGYASLGLLLGDLDFDGDIDSDDIDLSVANFTGHLGSSVMTALDGDTDGDGDVDNKDIGYLLESV